MSKLLHGAVIVLIAVTMTGRSALADGPVPEPDRLIGRVQVLTAPALAGRGSGTAELAAAADTLAGWLAAAGLEPAFAGSWFQEFDLNGEGWAGNDLAGRQDRNVAGIVRGRGALADRYVVIGAHYDHLGRVVPTDEASAPPAMDAYYPGANDNASGVTVVCELVALLRERSGTAAADAPADLRSVVVAFFGGEEVGLQGSGHFVAHPPIALDQVDAMVNFDTVGQLTDNRLYVSGVGTAARLPALAAAANTEGLILTIGQGGWSGSDHMSFNTREVPVLFVFGGPYEQYNRPADTWDSLDLADLRQVAGYGNRLLDLLRREPGPLQWVMVAAPELREGETGETNRDTWFGSLPDFTEDIAGYKLAGVFDDSPAARVGLEKGDVLVRMAGQEITNLADFTRVLRANAPGDLVEITILRDGKPLHFTLALGSRADRK